MDKTRIDIRGVTNEVEAEIVLEKAVTKMRNLREAKHELPDPVLRDALADSSALMDRLFISFMADAEKILSSK